MRIQSQFILGVKSFNMSSPKHSGNISSDHTEDPIYNLIDDYAIDSDELEQKTDYMSYVCRQAARYYVATVLIFGLLGNVGCLICYRRSEELKRYRSSGYLMALALSDLIFLLSLLFVWLKSIGVSWQDVQGICQISVYASNASIFLSAWYVMALTAEMAFALRRPYRAYAAAVDASKTVVLRILAVTVVGCAINSWTLALTQTGNTIVIQPEPVDADDLDEVSSINDPVDVPDPDPGSGYPAENRTIIPPISYTTGCHISSDDHVLHKTFVLLDIAITYSIPLLITLLLNCYIGYKLVQAGRQRNRMSKRALLDNRTRVTVSQPNSLQISMDPKYSPINRKRRPAQQLEHCPFTPMELGRIGSGKHMRKVAVRMGNRSKEAAVSSLLIGKSIAYLVFNTPSCAHRIWAMLKRESGKTSHDSNENWIQLIIYMLFYTQFSINFLLYSWHAYSRRRSEGSAKAAAIRSACSPAQF